MDNEKEVDTKTEHTIPKNSKHTNAKPATESNTKVSKKHRMYIVAGLLLVGVLIAGFALLNINDASAPKTANVSGTELKSITTYLSKSSTDENRKAQKDFNKGDPIQVGFKYDSVTDSSLVKFIVKNKSSGENVYQTNLFKLSKDDNELFVSVNNSDLPAGQYEVWLVDKEGKEIESVDFNIN